MNAPVRSARENRGGAAVGFLADLPPLEKRTVTCLRMWCATAVTRAQVDADFHRAFGKSEAAVAGRVLADLCELTVRYGRRPLMLHHAGCKCLGADESAFAHLVGAAASGEREDAMMFAMLLVRPDLAPGVSGLAQQAGLMIRRMLAREAACQLPLENEFRVKH
jgi:hypothetical protein